MQASIELAARCKEQQHECGAFAMTALVLGLAIFLLLYLLERALLTLAWVALLLWNLMGAVPAVRVLLFVGIAIFLTARFRC